MPTYRHCRSCGAYKGQKGGGYCVLPACKAIARERQARSPKKIAANSARLKAQWVEWKAAGHSPAHSEEAGKKRGAKIAASNQEKPRRKRKEPLP